MSTSRPRQRQKPQPPLLSPRAALILTLAILCGIGAGLLTFSSGRDTAQAVLAGCTATAAAVLFWDSVIGA